jgi:universal stress protein E
MERRIAMKQFKNILLVATGQESDRQSLGRAVELAKRSLANLSLIEVVDAPASEISKLSFRLKGLDLNQLVVEERKARLAKLAANAGFEFSRIDVVFGTPFIKIIQQVQRYGYDLVIAAAEGKGGLNERLFGTTSLHLMRKCPCPVWIHKATKTVRYRRILAAVDLFEPDSVKEGLNGKILELSASMAEIESAELHIVHVWDFFGETILLKRVGMTRTDLKTMVAEIMEKHRLALEDLVKRYPAPNIRRVSCLKRGNPGDIIPKFAGKIRANLIVIGTVSRQGIPGLLIGNTAERVLQRMNASVLTVKPEGFVSPVTRDF